MSLRILGLALAVSGLSILSSAGERPMWQRVSKNLYLFPDTCNVYAVKSGDAALLIDFGSGKCLDHLSEIGVKSVEWVLFTHHHRDQCQGAADGVLARHNIRAAAPNEQLKYFTNPAAVWKDMTLYHNYTFKPDFFEPVRPIPVDKAITPGEVFQWKGFKFEALASTGHTSTPGLTYVAAIDGKRTAFTGDLIHSPGKVWTYYDLQWGYNNMCGVDVVCQTLQGLKKAAPDALLPSHGVAMDAPGQAIDETVANLRRALTHIDMNFGGGGGDVTDSEGRPLVGGKMLPHMYHWKTNYAFIADNGHALFYDFEFWDEKEAETYIDMLRKTCGLKQIDIITFSHYHDDHVLGVDIMKNKYGAKLWSHQCLADVLEHPYAYNIPCLGDEEYPDDVGPKVDRVLKEDETIEWEGMKFTFFHFPGQTEFHQGCLAEVDGHRMLLMGDSTWRPPKGGIFRGEYFNFRNYCRLGKHYGYAHCGEVLKKFKPDIALSAHCGRIDLNDKMIEEYCDWANQLEPLFRAVVAREDPNFGTDPNWMSFYPYRQFAEAGETLQAEVRIRNHGGYEACAVVTPVLPSGWTAEPKELRIEIPAHSAGAAKFRFTVPKSPILPMRTVVTANVVFDGHDYGEFPEALVDKRSEKATWAKICKTDVRKILGYPPLGETRLRRK